MLSPRPVCTNYRGHLPIRNLKYAYFTRVNIRTAKTTDRRFDQAYRFAFRIARGDAL